MTNSNSEVALVAGGAGFIGSHLCEALLDAGCQVICIDSFLTSSRRNIAELEQRQGFSVVEQDICSPLQIDGPVGRVYNLACAASPPRYQADPVHTMLTSVTGTNNLLVLAEQKAARFLQASTSEVYGDPEQHPQSEDYWGNVNCTGPRACYDEGKRAAEALCFDYLRLGRVDARVARIFNTYGPKMEPDDGRIVSNLIMQALGGTPLTIYGTGEQTRSFCYVSDLVRGLVALMEVDPNPGGPVNLGNPGEFTINELSRIVAELMDVAHNVVHEALPKDDPQRRRPDITRARSLLGWEASVTLREGLPDTVAWFARQQAGPDSAQARPATVEAALGA